VKVLSMDVVHIEDVPVEEVWGRLETDAASLLIDVRTRAEWAFVGLPDLAEIGKRVLTVEWQTSPETRIDAAFPERLAEVLDAAGADKETELFFICRSGGRSRMAAEAMANAGYRRCRNVADGFEGPLDANRHRGRVAGWKAAGLAWVQG
jgi:rhodanese-related sulfurtransferase